jgi:high-affinity Fe2+/Pb2+ permease
MSKELINSGKNWWWTQRCRYNKGLFCAGLIAFFIYCTLGELIIARYTEFEETIFEMAFQGGCYMFLMMLANLFYTFGWIIDFLFNKNDSQKFRNWTFGLIYWFSFGLPILFILSIMLRFIVTGR